MKDRASKYPPLRPDSCSLPSCTDSPPITGTADTPAADPAAVTDPAAAGGGTTPAAAATAAASAASDTGGVVAAVAPLAFCSAAAADAVVGKEGSVKASPTA